MAKRQINITATRATTTHRRQQLLFKYSTICIVIVVLLARLDGGGIGMVNALSISLNGNGNSLQHQQQDDNSQQTQHHQLEHVGGDGEIEEVHNYIKQKSTTELVPNSIKDGPNYDNVAILNGNGIGRDLTRSQLSMGSPFHALKLIKRAPGGFVGMRGKKDASYDNEDQDFLDDDESLAVPWQNLVLNGKSADGDNDIDDLFNWNGYAEPFGRRYKKAPTAFYGVRGKKFTPGNGLSPSGDTLRWNQFLQKLDEDHMRDMVMGNVMDRLLNNMDDGYEEGIDDAAENDINKRAPTGFTGVRGKRPALSFSGVDTSMEAAAKRGSGHAFVGVRGKKDVSNQTFKRSPFGSGRYFFDFWKKSAGGPGGKRQRFTDFGNKFVAVRGKKSPFYGEQLLRNDWTLNDNNFRRAPAESTLLSSLLAAETAYGEGRGDFRPAYGLGAETGTPMHLLYATSDKRAPAGFQGMRGKRPLTSDDLLTNN